MVSVLKAGARGQMRANAPRIFITAIIFVAITTIMSELRYRLPGTADAYGRYLDQLAAGKYQNLNTIFSYLRPTGLPFYVLLWLAAPIINAGFLSYTLKISREQGAEYKDLMNGFLYFGKIVAIHVVTSALVFLWSLLFIFPGIAAHYRYRQAVYILFDDPRKGVFQCIGESRKLMRRNKTDLFILDMSFLGWFIADIAVAYFLPVPVNLPVISIFLMPYLCLTRAAYYNRLISDIST